MITAEDYLEKKFPEFEDLNNGNIWNNIEKSMIEFAKLHVKAALKKAEEIAINFDCEGNYDNSILNSYPLENIK